MLEIYFYKGSMVFTLERPGCVYMGRLGRLRKDSGFVPLLMKLDVFEGSDHVETQEHQEPAVFAAQDEVCV